MFLEEGPRLLRRPQRHAHRELNGHGRLPTFARLERGPLDDLTGACHPSRHQRVRGLCGNDLDDVRRHTARGLRHKTDLFTWQPDWSSRHAERLQYPVGCQVGRLWRHDKVPHLSGRRADGDRGLHENRFKALFSSIPPLFEPPEHRSPHRLNATECRPPSSGTSQNPRRPAARRHCVSTATDGSYSQQGSVGTATQEDPSPLRMSRLRLTLASVLDEAERPPTSAKTPRPRAPYAGALRASRVSSQAVALLASSSPNAMASTLSSNSAASLAAKKALPHDIGSKVFGPAVRVDNPSHSPARIRGTA